MATRFYLPSTGAPSVSPSFGPGWTESDNADRITAVTTKISSAHTEKSWTKSSSTNPTHELARQYVSAPISAQTITGTFTSYIRAREPGNTDNVSSQVLVKVVSGDGSTVRGTLVALDSPGALTSEWIATSTTGGGTNRRFPRLALSNTVTSVTAQAGDRIVMEFGGRQQSTSTGRVSALQFGDAGASDLPADETTTTTTLNPWAEFSQTLTFEPNKWYVDSSIGTSGDGTSWGTAWKAFSNIVWGSILPGDTLYLSGGSTTKTYTGALVVGASGSSGSPITITRGVDAGHTGTPVLDGQNVDIAGIDNGDTSTARNYITVSKLSFKDYGWAAIGCEDSTDCIIEDNTILTGSAASDTNRRGIDVRRNVNLTVRRNTITTPTNTIAQTDGIFSQDNTNYLYEGNDIHVLNTDTTGHSDAIQLDQENSGIVRNNVLRSPTAGIDNHVFWCRGLKANAVLQFYNNLCLSQGGQHNVGVWRDAITSDSVTLRIYNNTIIGGDRCVYLENVEAAATTEIKNNILWPAPSGVGFYFAITMPPTSGITHNLVWTPSASTAWTQSAGTRTYTQFTATDGYNANGVNADPAFASPGTLSSPGGDFRLLTGSPAIDAGTTLASVTTDRAGVSRPVGSSYDLGAHEGPATIQARNTTAWTAVQASFVTSVPAVDISTSPPKDGDVLIAAIEGTATGAASMTMTTVPSGWTLIDDQTDSSSTDHHLWVYEYRWHTGDPTSWSAGAWTASGSMSWAVAVMAYSGVNQTSPIAQSLGTEWSGASVATHTTGSLTVSAAGAWMVAVFCARDGQTWTPGSGITERADVSSGSTGTEPGMLLADTNGTVTSGASVQYSATNSGATSAGVQVLIELKQALASTGAVALAASATVQATVTANLAATRPLATSATVAATTTAGLGVARPLATSTTVTATPTATLGLVQPLAASATVTATPTAALIVARPLAGTTTVTATPTASLAVARPVAATATVTTTPAAALTATLAFTSAGQITVTPSTAQLGVAQPLASTATIATTTTGDLSVTGGTLATIAFRGASTVSTGVGTGTSLACPVPASTTDGDGMLAVLYFRAQETVTDPSGWTRVNPSGSDGSGHLDDSGMRSILYRRVATTTDETDTTSYTWSWTTACKAVVVMGAWDNLDPAQLLVQAVAVNEPGSSVSSHTTGSVTTASANDWLASFYGTTSSSAWTADAADTERAEANSSGTGPVSGMLADSNGPVSVGSYTRTASQTGTTSAGAFYLVALKPAAGGGGPQTLASSVTVTVDAGGSLASSSLDAQLQAAQPGDVIFFTGDQIMTKTYVAGTQSQPIYVVGVGTARIVGVSTTSGNPGLQVLHDWYSFENFEIRNCKKGFQAVGASHGRLDRITCDNIGDEGFKWRRDSQHWYVEDCTATDCGLVGNGEGFYVGDSSSNWVNSTTPDVSGYVTLINPTVRRVPNDGIDVKEGAHHVKIKGGEIDFSVSPPSSDAAQGDSGVYLRGNDTQTIDLLVHGNVNIGVGFKVAQTTLNSVHYGDRHEFKAVETASQAGAMFEVASPTSDIEIYDDYVNGSSGGLVIGSGSPTFPTASSFTEVFYDDTEWPPQRVEPFGGSATISATTTAALTAARPLATVATVTSSATADLIAARPLTASATVTATPTAALTAGTINLAQEANNRGGSASTSVTATFASAPTAGNLLVLVMGGDKNTGTMTLTGWTKEVELLSSSVCLYMAWKVSDGTETSVTPSWANSSAAGNTLWVGEYTTTLPGDWTLGPKATSITDESVTLSKASGTTAAVSGTSLALTAAAWDSGTNIAPTGWSGGYVTQFSDAAGAGSPGLSVGELVIPSGTTAGATFSGSGTGDQISAAVLTVGKVAGTAVTLDAAATVTLATLAQLGVAIPVAASAAVTASATAALGVAQPVMASAVVTATPSADLRAARPLASSVTTVVTTTAALPVAVSLAAFASVTASTSASVAVSRPLASSVTITAFITASLGVSRPVAASTTVTAAPTGDLSIAGTASLVASTTVLAVLSANLAVARPLVAAASVTATTLAGLAVARPLASSTQIVAAATASLVLAQPLASSVTVTATTMAALAVSRPLAATVNITTSTTGSLRLAWALATSTTVTASTQADLNLQGAIPLAATTSITASTTGALRLAWALAATTAPAVTASASLTQTEPTSLAGSSQVTTSASTSLAQRHHVTGATHIQLDTAANLIVVRPLSASANIVTFGHATLEVRGLVTLSGSGLARSFTLATLTIMPFVQPGLLGGGLHRRMLAPGTFRQGFGSQLTTRTVAALDPIMGDA